MAIILSGDTHGLLDIDKVLNYFETYDGYSKTDYLIILGDAGVLWSDAQDEKVQNLLNDLPVTTLWLDGNHENFDRINSYPEEMWHGGKVHIISDSIIHLMRGQVYEIDGLKFFVFGGGFSIDKLYRTPGISWWEAEMPSDREYEEGLENLEKHDWKVDYILTHTCPESIAQQLVRYLYPGEETLQRYFERIAERTEYKEWYFGHWHMDKDIDRFHTLYDEMVELIHTENPRNLTF